MLKSVFCRLNSVTSRRFVQVTRNLSAVKPQFKNEHKDRNDKSSQHRHLIVFASIPTFLAFFQKKEEDQPESDSTFWDKILPEDLAVLVKKQPVEDETTDEGKLKVILKRTILAIRRKEFEKAEQMAHLALKTAQDIQSYDGITLCYDIMANLAFDQENYQKAEKLFESVLQRLLQNGLPQHDIKVLHISLKMAQLAELQSKFDEAKTNYIWTISKLDEALKMDPNYADLRELWGLANNFYGKYLVRNGIYTEAAQRLRIAKEVYLNIRGRLEPEYVDILNNLAVACLHIRDYDAADQFIDEALILASAYPELLETGIYHANKALICLKKGLFVEAERMCKHADKASKRSQDPDGLEQAKYCMEQLKKAMKK